MRFFKTSGFILILLFLCFGITFVHAQQTMPQDLYPETGAWLEPGNPGTGFFMEVQNGVLAGAYFGFENDGGNAWLLFNGTLAEGSNGVSWQLAATLTQSEGGECIVNCTTASSNDNRQVSDVGMIEIVFSSRSSATFRINSGEQREIVPLQFGVPASAPFEDFPDTTISDLQGEWLLRVSLSRLAAEAGIIENGMLVEFGEPVMGTAGSNGTTSITYPISRLALSADELLMNSNELVINNEENTEVIGELFCADGRCRVDVCDFFTPGQCDGGFAGGVNQFVIADLTDHRFFAITEVGFDPPSGLASIEGFRLDYD